ncbi:3-hydroxybutyrate dehydrogenase [Azohydromonas lata]|uniref:3-hydroxybutyrate dehydrogenase n=1 Tax=Azohydromonas lata TaxID=45677 RepID=A0ABU5IJD3_9BURK|nr:3-hydroxybutyrate dehydrogenase [Azohydromonas lata]MDZ5459006.1 3-hydroxybutyrate dehydrogenase [Azohydromonas lata]
MLEGKTAIVTGSTSGIGLGIARAFAAQGAHVMLNGLGQADEIEFTRGALQREFGVRVAFHGADMSRPDEIRGLAAQAEAAFGRVDIVVNNAGIQHVAPVEAFPQAKWDAILAINLTAAFVLTQAVVPGMKARRFGRLLNVASAHGLTASPFKSAYVAAKHGLVGFTRCVAVELAEFGITANTLCPGYVKTPLVDRQIADQARAHGISPEAVVRDVMLAHQARKAFVRVEELAALAVFLASDAAASMTATAIPMDGGWTQH